MILGEVMAVVAPLASWPLHLVTLGVVDVLSLDG